MSRWWRDRRVDDCLVRRRSVSVATQPADPAQSIGLQLVDKLTMSSR
jgi:hypothetical protein